MSNPMLIEDFYKLTHPAQFPQNTEYVYSNTTARSSRIEGINEIVVFGIQYLIEKYFIKNWNENFFAKPKDEVIKKFKRIVDNTLGKDSVDIKIFEDLHDLGYLPVKVKCLPEGTMCPIQVPFMTIINTDPRFYWITNFLETLTQTVIWQAITSATIASQYKKLLKDFAEKTSDNPEFVQWQGHDFSCRGMSSVESGAVSGAAHLLSFTGTDTITAIEFLEDYYGADVEKELVGGSVPATEHAVVCAGGCENEYETFRRIIEDVYPSGIVSVVSDTWDFWAVLTNILPALKSKIIGRNGKVVIRPDSGDPVKIVTGYFVQEIKYNSEDVITLMRSSMSGYQKIWGSEDAYDCVLTSDGKYLDILGEEITADEAKGSIVLLYETFGGSKNSKGYIDLDPHIGLIYGDSITYERCRQICERLKSKGFSSTNVVFGIGSYTYQHNTRDVFGIACKATYVIINGEAKSIFKDPKTGSSKKSAKGLLSVVKNGNSLALINNCTPEQEEQSELKTIFKDGVQYGKLTLSEIRKNLWGK
jgi:nicotinamide phosphoribosyltransferase